jgi:hypothetical protein
LVIFSDAGRFRPQLETVHPAFSVAFRHFLVNNSASRRHPLNVARSNLTPVADTVSMLDRTRQYISNRLDPAMWMPWKTWPILFGLVTPKIIEKQEGIEIGGISETEHSPQMHARTLHGGLSANDPFSWSNRHWNLQSEI